jgi:Flp pilus assembly protein TadB
MSQLVMPDEPILKKQTYASPLSFIGGTRRASAFARKHADTGWKWVFVGIGLLIYLPALWAFLVVWYFIVFVLFGVFTFPYRFMRRSQRKQEHLQRQQLATMQTMLVHQQQVMLDNQEAARRDREAKEG